MGVPILKPLSSGKFSLSAPISTQVTQSVELIRPPVNTLWTAKFLKVRAVGTNGITGGSPAVISTLQIKDEVGGSDDMVLDIESSVVIGAGFLLDKQYAINEPAIPTARPFGILNSSYDNDHWLEMFLDATGSNTSPSTIVINWLLTGLERPLP